MSPCFLEIKTARVYCFKKNAFDLVNTYGFIQVAHLFSLISFRLKQNKADYIFYEKNIMDTKHFLKMNFFKETKFKWASCPPQTLLFRLNTSEEFREHFR